MRHPPDLVFTNGSPLSPSQVSDTAFSRLADHDGEFVSVTGFLRMEFAHVWLYDTGDSASSWPERLGVHVDLWPLPASRSRFS